MKTKIIKTSHPDHYFFDITFGYVSRFETNKEELLTLYRQLFDVLEINKTMTDEKPTPKQNRMKTPGKIHISKKECIAMETAFRIAGISLNDMIEMPTILAILKLRQIKGTNLSINDVIDMTSATEETIKSIEDGKNPDVVFLYNAQNTDLA